MRTELDENLGEATARKYEATANVCMQKVIEARKAKEALSKGEQ